ncbi:RlmE family RNA methyltransferase [Acidisoma cellulosilytica]|uniref:Ribosomal RNA large subunit methyltransferase E n=1 Tax=Acidisoma cellulosilyticum TaxID=2802395 RepID=A0A964E6R8_9PROT|nr:RlmE family RNA methyltransferase [Acidisoma cellulosilyticum]MCB8883861.1 RlmE family RNA methyltransferase [Acidisoma cellulosilyticum]
MAQDGRKGPPGDPGKGAGRALTVTLKRTAGRSVASQRWLQRQLNDPYVTAAQKQGWRSRAAFKLIELDDRFQIIKKGMRVLDLGAAPGGWTQVALDRGAAVVVGIDLLEIPPIPGAQLIQGDATDPENQARIIELLGGKPDLFLSDMAPNTSGHASTDHIRIVALAEMALDLAFDLLPVGGTFVAKLFQGGADKHLLDPMKLRFESVKHAKPPASRKESSELYVIAKNFKG